MHTHKRSVLLISRLQGTGVDCEGRDIEIEMTYRVVNLSDIEIAIASTPKMTGNSGLETLYDGNVLKWLAINT